MIGKILKLDSKELEESLFLLESAISQIFNKQSSKLSYEELYRNVYYLVLNRFGEKAYTQTKVFLEKNIKIKYDNFNEAINEKNLSDLLLSWREINEMIKVANSICLYLHQRFIKVKKLPNIQEIGKKLFIKHFMNSEGIVYKKMMKDLMEGFLKDRKSEIVDKVTMTGITTLMRDLGQISPDFYKSYFETFISESVRFFRMESEIFSNNSSNSEYLAKCISRYQEEKQRIEEHFEDYNKTTLISNFLEIYITNNLKALMESEDSGLKFFLTFDKYKDLKNLYFFASLNDSCFEIIKKGICDYIMQNLNPLLIPCNFKKNFLNMIEKIFSFKDKMQKFIELSLSSDQYNVISYDKEIERAIKDCFHSFVNKDIIITNSLNKYIDFFMQKGQKKLNSCEIEANIEKIIEIFKLLINKDVFEIYYKKLLTKRLLIFKNSCEELELNFIKKITLICGTFFTSRFYSFFKDLAISNQNFKDFQKYSTNVKVDFKKFHIEVISQSIWSFEENIENFEFTEEISNNLKLFERFYQEKHPERKLKWMATIGVGTLKANFKTRAKELILSNIQIFTLLCFNQKKIISFNELQAKLKIIKNELLKQCLKSFLKVKILLKSKPINGELDFEIKEDDQFLVNEHFAHRNYEIKIPLKQNDEYVDKIEQKNLDTLHLERKIIIESYLIRILKARKKIVHADLIKEVSNFCANKNFVPTLNQIKDSIESLINREYIKRNEDINVYSYIA